LCIREAELILLGGVSGEGLAFRFLPFEDILIRIHDISLHSDLLAFRAANENMTRYKTYDIRL
jgi:hypothetical protein